MSIDDFFDNVAAAAMRAASSVATDVSIAAQEQKIRDAYRTIGKLYHQAVEAGTAPQGPEFDSQMALIRSCLDEIARLRNADRVD